MAWYHSKKYNMEYDDLQSEGYVIFCEAMNRFNSELGTAFSTFLFHRLRTLNDYCRKMKRYSNIDNIDDYYDLEDRGNESYEIFYEAMERLSSAGRTVMEAVIKGEFERPGYKGKYGKIRLQKTLIRKWELSRRESIKIVDELENFYKKVA
jgi:hypothetical protein